LLYFQACSKSIQIQPSPAKPEQNKSKKKAWISLDFFVRIEPFQWVTATLGKKSLLLPLARRLPSPQAGSGRAGRSIEPAIQKS
jgi:hypothetical protein